MDLMRCPQGVWCCIWANFQFEGTGGEVWGWIRRHTLLAAALSDHCNGFKPFQDFRTNEEVESDVSTCDMLNSEARSHGKPWIASQVFVIEAS